MTSDGISVLGMIFSIVWQLFTAWYIPGTGITPAMALIGIAACSLSFRFFLSLGNLGPSFGRTARDFGSKAADRHAAAKTESARPHVIGFK